MLKNKKIYGTMLVGFIIAGVITGGFYSTSLDVDEEGKLKWNNMNVVLGADVDPGNGNDGIVNIYIYPLGNKADVNTGCSEATAYEHGDDVNGWSNGEELTDETPYGTSFFICVEVQFSDKAYNDSGVGDWDLDLVRAYITCGDLANLGSPTLAEEGTDFFDQDGTTDAKLSFYWDNSDAGWQIGQGEQISVTDLDIQYYG